MDPTPEDGTVTLEPLAPVEGIVDDSKGAFIRKRDHLDHSLRATIGRWLHIRNTEPNLTNVQIAERLNLSYRTLLTYISRANKSGILKFEDPLDRIEYDLIPKVVDNLDYWLKKNDKQVTLETAKNTIFKVYQDSKGISEAPQTVLALKIEQAPPEVGEIVKGVVVGKARSMNHESEE